VELLQPNSCLADPLLAVCLVLSFALVLLGAFGGFPFKLTPRSVL
jgi:hypothetical protein